MMRGPFIRWLAGIAALLGVLLAADAPQAQQKVQVDFWHGLTQPLGGILEKSWPASTLRRASTR